MAINFKKARDFVYANGQLWERALFAYLFQEGSLSRVHDCLRVYRNPDGGYAHGLEHDIRSPSSHPLALEYLLRILADCRLPAGDLLDGAAAWLEANQNEDGSLKNPSDLHDYPHAPWWAGGGQNQPDSIVGNLQSHGKANSKLLEKTRHWVQENRNLESIQTEEWLFMMYHAYDFFFVDEGFPDVKTYQQATLQRIVELAKAAPENQVYSLFVYVHDRDSELYKVSPELVEKFLNILESQQKEDGSWGDQHDLPHWSPYWTIIALQRLKTFGYW